MFGSIGYLYFIMYVDCRSFVDSDYSNIVAKDVLLERFDSYTVVLLYYLKILIVIIINCYRNISHSTTIVFSTVYEHVFSFNIAPLWNIPI